MLGHDKAEHGPRVTTAFLQLFADYKAEMTEALSGDRQLLAELEYDLRQFGAKVGHAGSWPPRHSRMFHTGRAARSRTSASCGG